MFPLLIILLGLLPASQAESSPATMETARQLVKQGKFTEAAAAYRSIIDRHKNSEQEKPSPLAYTGLVESLLKSDDVPAADDASRQAVATLPDSASVHAARGDVYFRQALLEQAVAEYKSALKLDEKCARAWLGMGKVDASIALQAEAGEKFTRAHELDQEDGDILYRWAVTLPYPKNVQQLEHYVAEFHFDSIQERRNREYLALVKALAGRTVWVPEKAASHNEIRIEPLIPGPGQMLGYGIKANLNGKATATLLLDTGASWATITKKLADKIGARRLSEQALEGSGGAASSGSYLAWVDHFNAGGVEFRDCIVHVSPQNDLAGAEGLLGTEVFDHNLLTLDITARRLVLDALPDPPVRPFTEVHPYSPQKISTRQLFQFGHLLLVPADVNHKAIGLFVLDTGSNATALSPRMAGQAGSVAQSKTHVHGMGGDSGDSPMAQNATLQFSGVPEKAQDLITTDLNPLSKNLGIEVSGIIGFPSLSKLKVVIDYRDGWVEFRGSSR